MESNSLGEAETVFFPEAVYVSMKTGILPDPTSDFVGRLLAFYSLDLVTYHDAISSAHSVHLVEVIADSSDAEWISPGDCENHFGYWHLPGVRLVYRMNGVVKSFAVASLISWRGQWYVVHLGPNPRPESVGTVDQPANGAGLPGPPGGC